MEKRALIAIVLSIVILILYQEWVGRYFGPTVEEEATEEVTASREARRTVQKIPQIQTKAVPPLSETRPVGREVKELRVETDRYIAIFTSKGARLKSLLLKQYRTSVEKDSPLFEMIIPKPGVPYPLGVQFQGRTQFNDERLVYEVQGGNLNLTGHAIGTLSFRGRIPGGGTLIKRFTFTGSTYPIGLEVSVRGEVGAPQPSLILTTGANSKEVEAKNGAIFEGLIALVGGKLIREDASEISEGREMRGEISWAGFGHTYFFFAVLPEAAANQTLSVKKTGPGFLLSLGGQTLARTLQTTRYTLFVGPKDLDLLKSLGKGLERSIDFGWFTLVAAPLLHVLRFFHRFTGSYGIDIILLTFMIKLLLSPLTHKSFMSMKQMQKLQPQMQRIKEKFKTDKEKMNKEIMDLYRRNKVNPLGGCLPMLFQFPVFIGLYNALRTPIDLRHTSFLWIQDLSRPDYESLPFTLGNWEVGVPVLVLLMGASMFIQQWMTPSVGDPNQRRMMMMMPVVFTVMFVTFPAGLTIYWLINNILTIGQQYVISRMTK